MLLTEKLVASSKEIKSKDDLFSLIVDLVDKEKRTSDKSKLLADIKKREAEGDTAFENGLMIPHARTKFVNETTLVVVDFNDQDFNSLDGKKTNFAVAILVPDSKEQEHLVILSKISSLFSDEKELAKFKKATAKEKINILNTAIEKKEEVESLSKYDIVAITACAAGIAHTYMARDGLIKAAKDMGMTIKVETRGAMAENRLTDSEIDSAAYVIIAADVTVPKKPFAGKKIHETDTNSAIKNGKSVIEEAKKAPVWYGKGESIGKLQTKKSGSKNVLGKAVMSALSFMIPVTIVGGILMAIPNATAGAYNGAHGGTGWQYPNVFTQALNDFGHIGLLMMTPILAMFLAYRLGGKPAIPAALIGGYFINDGTMMAKYSYINIPSDLAGQASAGFLGGLVVGILVGYMVRLSRVIKWHPWVKPVSALMIIPIISSFLTFLIVLYVIGGPMTWVMAEIFQGLKLLQDKGGLGASLGIGILFSILIVLDLGGPINKTANVVATAIFAATLEQGIDQTNFVPQTAVQAAISVPPLGMWLATMIFRKKFSLIERTAGAAALPMGLFGITEGALPFAFRTPLKAIGANVAGAIVAGGLVTLFNCHFFGGLGSPLGAYLGYIQNSFYGLLWILATFAGGAVTGVLYGLMRKRVPEYEEAIKAAKEEKMAEYKKLGLNSKKEIRAYKNKEFRTKFKERAKYVCNPKNWFEKPSDWDPGE